MADIAAGPDMLVRVLREAKDTKGAEIGEEPRNCIEIASEKLVQGRLEARRRIIQDGERIVKVETVIRIVDTITPGKNGAARIETPKISIVSKTSKPREYDGKEGWIDEEGNQIGEVEKQTTIAAVAAIDTNPKKKVSAS